VNKGVSQEALEKITMSMSEQLGLLGRKVGMMRIFTDDGDAIPVTVLDVSNNRVAQVKTAATDGYSALQIAFGSRKASRVTKPEAGHLAKAGVESGTILKEFRVTAEVAGQYAAGAVVPANVFATGQKVDVQGTSIGKGFAGTIKRHNFKSQRASHGNSRSHNVPGSISMAQDPGRVFPGCCWCVVRCRARKTATWSFAPPSKPSLQKLWLMRPRKEPSDAARASERTRSGHVQV
jgi:large subunit ribosomal protein L3